MVVIIYVSGSSALYLMWAWFGVSQTVDAYSSDGLTMAMMNWLTQTVPFPGFAQTVMALIFQK